MTSSFGPTRRSWLSMTSRMLLATAVVGARPVFAQDYPSKPITLVVAYPAGGATDAAARLVATYLGPALKQTIVVDNLGGASGSIAAQRVVRSQADGYTLLAGTINEVVLAPLVNKGVTYTSQDLAPVGEIGSTPFVLVANPKFAANGIDELLATLRKSAQPVTVGIPGVGTLHHIAFAIFAQQAGLKWIAIPYKGAAPLNADLLGGQIDLAVVTMPSGIGFINDGKLKSYGVMSERRDATYKDLPTINEGREIKGISTDAWLGLFAPAHTPEPIVSKLNAALVDVMKMPEVRSGLVKLGFAVNSGSSDQFVHLVTSEQARYRSVVSSIKLDR